MPIGGYGTGEVDNCLQDEGDEAGGYVVEGGPHAAELHKGQYGRGGRDEVVGALPVPGHELEGVGDSREEDEPDGEEGDEQDGCLGIGVPARQGKPQEGGAAEVGHEEHGKAPHRSTVRKGKEQGERAQEEEGKQGIEDGIGEALATHERQGGTQGCAAKATIGAQ